MAQLPESDLTVGERLTRIRDAVTAGCTSVELYADLEVALSVLELG